MAVEKTGTGARRVEREEIRPEPKCVVYFRPHSDYKGEFGFDWLRVKDNGLATEPDYESIIENGYRDGISDLNRDAYAALMREYKQVTVRDTYPRIADIDTYRVPYLNLFSKTFYDTFPSAITPKPPYQAKLDVLVGIKDTDVDEIKFEFNENFLSINGRDEFSLSDKAITPLKKSTTITIACKRDITTDKNGEILVYAIKDGNRRLAGKLMVGKNDVTSRKEAKFVFVCVRTNIDERKIGTFTKNEKDEQAQSRNILYQALVRPFIWVGTKHYKGLITRDIVLDLSNDPDFKLGGKYINPDGSINLSSGKIVDPDDSRFQIYPIFGDLRKKFMDNPANSLYQRNKCIPIFAFGEGGSLFGMAESIGKLKSAIVFNSRLDVDDSTTIHEVLHCFGLRHTFRESDPINDDRQKYIFKAKSGNEATDNIMSYNDGNMITTWNWQWKIIRNYIR